MKIIAGVLVLLGITGFVVKQSGIIQSRCTKPASVVSSSNSKPVTGSNGAKGFAFVELFTSEGCSSCPPADALIAKLVSEKKDNVYVLSYHVDYWDRLGWKDVFSKPEWTARQANYVSQFHLESAYTPQAVINGTQEFVGSSGLELYKAVDKEINVNSQSELNVEATAIGGEITVSYKTSAVNGVTINLVLVKTHAVTAVRRGENSGKQLAHTNVVLELIKLTGNSEKGEAHFSVPASHSANEYKIIGFLQSPTTLKITAAAEASIQ